MKKEGFKGTTEWYMKTFSGYVYWTFVTITKIYLVSLRMEFRFKALLNRF